MVAITASVNGFEDQANVSCALCFWGDDVPVDKALQVATEHEASDAHIEAEVAEAQFEAIVESLRVKRGH